jgi:hypothetical protein
VVRGLTRDGFTPHQRRARDVECGGDPTYNALRLRLEIAHAAVEAAAVEARRRVRLNESR